MSVERQTKTMTTEDTGGAQKPFVCPRCKKDEKNPDGGCPYCEEPRCAHGHPMEWHECKTCMHTNDRGNCKVCGKEGGWWTCFICSIQIPKSEKSVAHVDEEQVEPKGDPDCPDCRGIDESSIKRVQQSKGEERMPDAKKVDENAVGNATDQLHKAVEETRAAFSILRDRLQPVLLPPEAEQTREPAKEKEECTLINDLKIITCKARIATDDIQDLLKRLRL